MNVTRAMGAAMRRIHVGNALSAFGLGFTVPYLYVYVAQVRGLGAVTAGLVLAVFAVAALTVLPFAGRAIVRRGPLPVLLTALVTAAVGALSLGLAGTAATVLLSAAALGAGQAVMQPALATMIVDCSTADTRSRAFAMQFFLQNLGLGVGGLIGGHLVDTSSTASFTVLFAIEAAMFLLLAVVMTTVRMPHSPRVEGAPPSAKGSWKQLLGNRAMVQLSVLGFVLFFACYGQFESGLSAYGVEAAGISTSTLGTALAANTAMIVVAQFAVLRFVERRKRSRVIAAVGLIWAVAWLMAGYAGLGHGSQEMATAAFVSTYALFGLGEAMLSPTVAPLVADLAPEGMAGQYNSAFALVKQLALAVGPAVGGPMGASLHAPYIVTFLLFSLGISVLALRLGRHLTAVQNQPSLRKSRVVAQGGAQQESVTA
ncbi:integral membrane protein [Streptomyces lincolnensis]|uniref:Integral membrane protein n=2 Tax=Streptomyces lincolnensis TaxID=1915 RepID=A0A1B1MCC0_STRLN|nr:integral membrane protein [Streptomyces lincolnensis]AXG55113.1 integral membrane protein [Streptomyces lincolnensis]QMV08372.1 MFS transporter [Streptomyces lincolnensis]